MTQIDKKELEKSIKFQLLKEFGINDNPESVDFCREAYKFLTEQDENVTRLMMNGGEDVGRVPMPDGAANDHAYVPAVQCTSAVVGDAMTAVDLSLPSGTLWADRNIGAKSPTDYGAYFSWGNTTPHYPKKGENDWGCEEDAFDYSFNSDEYKKTEGAKCDKDLDLQHDAAYMNTDGLWKTPSKEQYQELYDNCRIQRRTINGVNGLLFVSNINNNSVFFPSAGYGRGTSLGNRSSVGCYWSRSWLSSDYGYFLYFYSGSVYPQDNYGRYYGFSVRAVQDSPTLGPGTPRQACQAVVKTN